MTTWMNQAFLNSTSNALLEQHHLGTPDQNDTRLHAFKIYIIMYNYNNIYIINNNSPNTQEAPRTLRPIVQVKGMHRHLTCMSSLDTSPVLP